MNIRIGSNRRRRRKTSTQTTVSAFEKLEDRALLSAVVADAIEAADTDVFTEEELLRLTTVEYADGVDSPAGEDRESARAISNAVAAQDESVLNDRGLTDYVWIFGQFLDHDIDLTEGSDPAESFDIEVPAGDAFFDPFGTGEATIELNRSAFTVEDGIRQQVNQITSLIDGSNIYGSDAERTDALRSFEGGRLLVSEGDLLPYNTEGLENAGGTGDTLFLAGDVRANENVALISMHTVWVREHNRIADEISAENPDLTDDEIFEEARSIVTAQLQAITYNEFLPALLGEGTIDQYTGFDASVDPSISNVFSTAAFRLGHSLLSPELQRLDADGNVVEEGNLALQSAFFRPDIVAEDGIDSILRGAATQLAQELDSMVIDDVRNFLFGAPGSGGFDLASLNIQRGRDHGLADYNQVRVDFGLEPVTSFSEISSDPDVVAALESVYDSVDNIDVWVGGLAEDHVDGGSVGELFTTIISDQFARLRDGDPDFYLNSFSGQKLREINNTTLADVIERNTEVTDLQDNLFFDEASQPVDEDTNRHKDGSNRKRDKTVHDSGRAKQQNRRARVSVHRSKTRRAAVTKTNDADEAVNDDDQNQRRRRSRRSLPTPRPVVRNVARLDAVFANPMKLR